MIWQILISSALGLAIGIGWWMAFRPVMLALGRLVLRPSRRKPRQRWMKGTQFVLSGQLQLAIWIALILPSPLTQGLLSLFLPGWIAVLGGSLVLLAVVMEIITDSTKRHAIERTLLPVAVDNLLAHASVDYSTRMLEYTLHSPDAMFRLAAVKGLAALGTPAALKLLGKSSNDPDPEVRLASERGAESIRRAQGEGTPLSTAVMPALFKEHAYWSDKLDSLTGQEFKAAARRLIEFEHSMTEVVNSQMALRTAFPDLWCMKCSSRMVESRYSRWRYVHCGRCGDVMDVKVGVRCVIGRIGSRDGHIEKRDVLVHMWDATEKKPSFAEVDILEVCNDGKTDLEWAINSVVNLILEQWAGRTQAIEVRLLGNPQLSDNARKLLQQLNA